MALQLNSSYKLYFKEGYELEITDALNFDYYNDKFIDEICNIDFIISWRQGYNKGYNTQMVNNGRKYGDQLARHDANELNLLYNDDNLLAHIESYRSEYMIEPLFEMSFTYYYQKYYRIVYKKVKTKFKPHIEGYKIGYHDAKDFGTYNDMLISYDYNFTDIILWREGYNKGYNTRMKELGILHAGIFSKSHIDFSEAEYLSNVMINASMSAVFDIFFQSFFICVHCEVLKK